MRCGLLESRRRDGGGVREEASVAFVDYGEMS